jgi:hypothetical protein
MDQRLTAASPDEAEAEADTDMLKEAALSQHVETKV